MEDEVPTINQNSNRFTHIPTCLLSHCPITQPNTVYPLEQGKPSIGVGSSIRKGLLLHMTSLVLRGQIPHVNQKHPSALYSLEGHEYCQLWSCWG